MFLNKVTIDSVDYAIETTDDFIILNGQQCAADVDYNLALIRLNKDIACNGRGVHTLMHEIMHALLIERGMDEFTENEALVDALASGIVNLIRANSKLIDFIKLRRKTPSFSYGDISREKVSA